MVDGLRIFLLRIDPGLEHFQDKHAVLVNEASIGYLAFEVGETFSHERRSHSFGGHRRQTESRELVHVAA